MIISRNEKGTEAREERVEERGPKNYVEDVGKKIIIHYKQANLWSHEEITKGGEITPQSAHLIYMSKDRRGFSIMGISSTLTILFSCSFYVLVRVTKIGSWGRGRINLQP